MKFIFRANYTRLTGSSSWTGSDHFSSMGTNRGRQYPVSLMRMVPFRYCSRWLDKECSQGWSLHRSSY